MRAPAEVRLERLQRLIQRLSQDSEQGGIIVVEGQRDRDSLRKMGIIGTILCLQSSRKNIVGFVEELDNRRDVIVLTDFDRQGVFLAKRLARILNSQSIHVNLVLWRELRGLTRSDVRSIEELPKFHQRLQTEVFFGVSAVDREYEARLLAKRRRRQRNYRERE
jgi:5S rRNA maturation endonuclease (ribonuclease M5)